TSTNGAAGAPVPAPPEPAAADIVDLVSAYRGAGLDVEFAVRGKLTNVSPTVGLALYRIAQESLANVAKHAPGAAARITVDVAAECDDGDEVVAAVEAAEPDVVVMDVRMKRVDGAEATRQLRHRGDRPPVLVLTTFDDDEVLSAALRAGAAGFQLKDAPGEELIRAARA